MKKKLMALLLVGLMATFAACGGETTDEGGDAANEGGEEATTALDKDTLVVGTSADFPPFENVDVNGDIVGFDIDLINEIGKELGKEIQIENMDFDGLVGAVQTDKIDMAISGMTDNADRRKNVNFSDSYYEASQAILVREDVADVASMDDLSEKIVGSQL